MGKQGVSLLDHLVVTGMEDEFDHREYEHREGWDRKDVEVVEGSLIIG